MNALAPPKPSRSSGLFDLDLRSLAVFRVALGFVLVADVWIRSYDFEAHYTDLGWLPLETLGAMPPQPWSTSLFHLDGGGPWAAFLFLVLLTASLAFLVGWRTRVMGVLCWFLTLHLQARNPLVLDGADMLLRHLLFWGLFLPLGARGSVDAWLDPAPSPAPSVGGPAAFALAMQPVLLYEFAAMTKVQPAWLTEGMGVTYALMLDQLVKPLGKALLGYPGVLWGLNYATLVWEYLGPLLLFSPVATTRLRLFAILGFFALQFGFGQTIRLMFFPWVSSIALVPLLPGVLWDRLGWRHVAAPEAASSNGRPLVSRRAHGLSAALFVYTFFWNVQALPDPLFRFPAWLRAPGLALRLEQQWYLFAPPWRTDGWYVTEGIEADGTRVDLRTGAPLDVSKPESTYQAFSTHRTWAFLRGLGFRAARPPRQSYMRALRERCPRASRLVAIRLWYYLELSLPDGTTAPVEPVLLYQEVRYGGAVPAAVTRDVPGIPGAPSADGAPAG